MFKVCKIKNSIISGDSIESLRLIPNESVDLIFADPPYWMQTEGELLRVDGSSFRGVDDHWDKFNTYEEYDKFSEGWLRECYRVLKPNGSIWVIGSFQNIYRIGYIMQNIGFWIINDVVWSKPNAVPNFAGTRLKNSHETMLWCTKNKKAKYTFNYKTMKHVNNNKQDTSVWNIGICIGSERLRDADGIKIHSTQKPEALLYKIILASSEPNDVVLDPFFGTGTTGAVAKRLGRNFIGIEREERYISAARDRIDKVKVETAGIHMLGLETKPPRVSISKLVSVGYLTVGENFYNRDGEFICTLTSDGYVTDGEEMLSIHKMSAKHLKKINNNGWTFFYVMRGGELKSIDTFRYEYSESDNE
ncbi:MAG: DNA methyltransferase [Candidatus Nanogingivalis sp.]